MPPKEGNFTVHSMIKLRISWICLGYNNPRLMGATGEHPTRNNMQYLANLCHQDAPTTTLLLNPILFSQLAHNTSLKKIRRTRIRRITPPGPQKKTLAHHVEIGSAVCARTAGVLSLRIRPAGGATLPWNCPESQGKKPAEVQRWSWDPEGPLQRRLASPAVQDRSAASERDH